MCESHVLQEQIIKTWDERSANPIEENNNNKNTKVKLKAAKQCGNRQQKSILEVY
jgi:hypothetical protein